ncbi:YceI family protein [Mucilaginibacter limnophilus]|uniref:YceI family protein n=1 Tax=Mucilaginibacter limnophilus TaxID=1932778 RepID=A0A3S2UMY2_9SPHI|nr:YceI family protein [Mucilaginibacter limnophilus]RVU01650.1 YceI family protein [Mucilaginibacter limnophilus]
MKKYFAFIILFLAAAATFAQTTITSSSVTFKVKNLGIMTDGKFGDVKATIKFDPSHLDSSNIDAFIDASSVNTDNDTRDDHLKGQKFFDVDKYPQITMKSTGFQKKGSGFSGKFNLTIKGITKPVDVPFTYVEANGKADFNGSFKISRRDFNVGGNSMVLGDEVTVNIKVQTAK